MMLYLGNLSSIRIAILWFLIVLFPLSAFSQQSITLITWNIQNLGKSKDFKEISFIAETIKNADILAIQEVVAGNGGAQAVAQLADELNLKGAKWDYTISNPTSGIAGQSERYAFIWKTNRLIKQGDAWLQKKFSTEISREPYLATFKVNGKLFTVVNFHALPKSKQPEREIKYLKLLPAEYPGKNLVFCGDFNCPQSHSVFTPLKALGYLPVLKSQKTSLRQKCLSDGCLASEYDNIFCKSSGIKVLEAGVIHFYRKFGELKEAKKISDHVPVYVKFVL